MPGGRHLYHQMLLLLPVASVFFRSPWSMPSYPKSTQSVLFLLAENTSLSFCASCCSNCLRVDSISGAASDSVSLISILQLGQIIVGSVMRFSCLARPTYRPSFP